MNFAPACPVPPTWAVELVIGLNALKSAAERAKTAHESASHASVSLTAEVAAAEQPLGSNPLYRATVDYDGYSRRQATEVLREITEAHSGLELSLALVWHRAAYAYACAVSRALTDLAQGQHALPTASHTAPVLPPLVRNGFEVHGAHARALEHQRLVRPSAQPCHARTWARSARSWHDFAEAATNHINPLLPKLPS